MTASATTPQPDTPLCEFIVPDSACWHQARRLRYKLFYQMHGLPESVMDDGLDAHAHHACITEGEEVIAYGRATRQKDDWFLVTAMVVTPERQKQGYGRRIMKGLIQKCIADNAKGLILKSRTTAAGFYATFGFIPRGEIFPSSITGIPHIEMILELKL